MGTFVENINTVAQGLTVEFIEAIEAVKPYANEIVVVNDNIADIVSVVDNIVPNLAEILQTDTNATTATEQAVIASAQAAIATAKASEATTKASEALVSANNAHNSEVAAAASANSAALNSVAGTGIIVSNQDINLLVHGGRYGCIGTPTHGAVAGECYVEVITDGSRIMQVATYTNGDSYTRVYSGSWGTWVRHTHADLQPLDSTLTALSGVSTSADKYIYATASDTFSTGTITSFGRSLVDDVDASTARGTLGISATNTPFTPAGNIAATNVQAAVQELDSEKAPLASPALTGTPTAPTAAVGTNTTQVATTEFVQAEIANDTFSKTELTMAIGNINSPLLDMPLKNSLAMKAGVGSATFTRASTATYIDRYGVLKTAAIDEPRFEKKGYLNEGSSTNLLLYSEQFDNAAWVKSTITITANTTETTDPYGSNLADKISKTAGFGRVQQTPTVSATPHTFSVFVKAGTADECTIRMMTGVAVEIYTIRFTFSTKTASYLAGTGTVKVDELANGWFRVALSATFLDTTSLCIIYPDVYNTTSTGSIYVFGAQLEALPFATSYIPTTSATVTRAADVLNITYLNNSPASNNTSDYSCLLDFDFFGVNGTSTHTLFRINDDGRMLRIATTRLESRYGGVLLNSLLDPVAKTKYRIAHTIGSVASIYVNGALSASGSRGTAHTTATVINIGQYSGSSSCYGHISNVRIYDKALTAQEVALA